METLLFKRHFKLVQMSLLNELWEGFSWAPVKESINWCSTECYIACLVRIRCCIIQILETVGWYMSRSIPFDREGHRKSRSNEINFSKSVFFCLSIGLQLLFLCKEYVVFSSVLIRNCLRLSFFFFPSISWLFWVLRRVVNLDLRSTTPTMHQNGLEASIDMH